MIDTRAKTPDPITLILIRPSEDDWHIHRKLFASYEKVGYQVRFAGWDRFDQKPSFSTAGTVECRYLMHGWGYAHWRLIFAYPIWMLRVWWYLLWEKVDIVHVGEFPTALATAIALWWRRTPFVYDIQDNFDQWHHWPAPLKFLIQKLDGWVAHRAQGIIVPDQNRIVNTLEKFRHKIIVIPNCPDDILTKVDDQTSATEVPFTIIAMGHLAERRGINLLLDVMPELPGTRLLMAGKFVEPWLQQKALSSHIVDFRGWLSQEDVLRLCLTADVIFSFYDPSHEMNVRASSNKWYDAMMVGKPMLVNREVMKADWIIQQNIGYLCRYGDRDELISTLRWIQAHREEAIQKGQRGRLLFENSFNWAVMEKKILQMVDAIIKQPQGQSSVQIEENYRSSRYS